MNANDYMYEIAKEALEHFEGHPELFCVVDGVCSNYDPKTGNRCIASYICNKLGVNIDSDSVGFLALRAKGVIDPLPGMADDLMADLLAWHDDVASGFPPRFTPAQILARIKAGPYKPEVPAPGGGA